MKKIVCAFMGVVAYCGAANAYKVCGPDVTGATDFAYSTVDAIPDANNRQIGFWAVGDNCTGGDVTENTDVTTMCDSIVAGGQAYCAAGTWGSADLNEASAEYGQYCWCRRTKMVSGGTLVDSEGQWVNVGYSSSVAVCRSSCAKYCAQHVNGDISLANQGYAIMMLPAF